MITVVLTTEGDELIGLRAVPFDEWIHVLDDFKALIPSRHRKYISIPGLVGQWLIALEHATALARFLREIQADVQDMRQATNRFPARPHHQLDTAWMYAELTKLVAIAHPDKHQNHPVATELTKAVLALRERIQEGAS